MTREELQTHYDQMWNSSVDKLTRGEYFIDPNLKVRDNRMGITLRIRPDEVTIDKISTFQKELCEVLPEQFHYPKETVHMTVLSIVSCSEENHLSDLNDCKLYIDLISEVLENERSFEIEHSGVTLGDVGLLLQGFPKQDALNALRERIRGKLEESELASALEKRYKINSAHSTVMRYQQELKNIAGFVSWSERQRDRKLGVTKVGKLELVMNDWYHSPEQTKICKTWELQ